MQHDRENDPERVKGSRQERSRPIDEVRNLDEDRDDLGREQSEGNLGNERSRNRRDEDRGSLDR